MLKRLREPKPKNVMDVRYTIEHRSFPHLFYNKTSAFLNYMMSVTDAAYSMFQKGFEYAGFKLPYQKEDFRVTGGRMTKDIFIVSIELPEPEFEPLCYRIHFLTDMNYERQEMYTIEKGMEGGFLCGWTRDVHVNDHAVAKPNFDPKGKGAMISMEILLICQMYAKCYGLELDFDT